MVAGGAAAEEYYEGVRIGPPPDLPSLLLQNLHRRRTTRRIRNRGLCHRRRYEVRPSS